MPTINHHIRPYVIGAGAFVLLVIIVAAYLHYRKPPVSPYDQQTKQLQHQYDSLATSVKSYKDSLNKIDSTIRRLKVKDEQLTGQLQYNTKMSENIKKDYEKTNRFDHYSSADIARYFADSLQ